VRGLKSLGVSAEQYGSLLIPIVMSKLPDDVRLQIARNTKEEIWKIEDLLETIKTEMRAREASEGIRVTSDSTKKPPLSNRPPFKPKETPTSSTFLSNQGLHSLLRSRFLGCHATLPPKKRLLTSEQHSFHEIIQSPIPFHFQERFRAKFAL